MEKVSKDTHFDMTERTKCEALSKKRKMVNGQLDLFWQSGSSTQWN